MKKQKDVIQAASKSVDLSTNPWPDAAAGLALDLWLTGVTATASGKLGYEFVTRWVRLNDLINLFTGENFEERDRWTREEIENSFPMLIELKYVAQLRDPEKHICFKEPTIEALSYVAQTGLTASWCRDLKLSLAALKAGEILTSEDVEKDMHYFRAKRVWAEAMRLLERISVGHPMVMACPEYRLWLADHPKNHFKKSAGESEGANPTSLST